ncbi:hypothetical protein TNCV_4000051 [Trichonephila clavipes]|nr:hypothetical protein TNCV_4000051 [Trichonephila clavipes]
MRIMRNHPQKASTDSAVESHGSVICCTSIRAREGGGVKFFKFCGCGSINSIRDIVAEILNGLARVQIFYRRISWHVVVKNFLKLNPLRLQPNCKNITIGIASPWVPTRVFSVKISKEKGSIIMCENSIEFRNINGAVWMSIDTRHSDFGVVT